METKKRKYEITIELDTETREEAEKMIREKFDVISIKCLKDFRSVQQNKSLHKWFAMLAEELNEKHFDMRAIIRKDIEIEWSGYNVKEYLFRPLMKAKFGKKSTKELFKSGEIDDLIDIITKVIAERTKGECAYVPFPSIENLREYRA